MRPLIARHQNNFTPTCSRIYIIVFPLSGSSLSNSTYLSFSLFPSACMYCLLKEHVNCTVSRCVCVVDCERVMGGYLAVHAVLNESDWQGGIYWRAPLEQRTVALCPYAAHTVNIQFYILYLRWPQTRTPCIRNKAECNPTAPSLSVKSVSFT